MMRVIRAAATAPHPSPLWGGAGGGGREASPGLRFVSIADDPDCATPTPALPAGGRESRSRSSRACTVTTERAPHPCPQGGGGYWRAAYSSSEIDNAYRVLAMTTCKPRFQRVSADKRAFARKLRNDATEPERALWRALREQVHPTGYNFRRQFVVGPYVADFCCMRAMLIIEVDGDQHGLAAGLAHDVARDQFLTAEGYRVLRFSNRDVMTSMSSVLDTIHASLFPLDDKDA
jgi:very-short-patch-repair endonuclease